jgi:transposase InsO family protein
MKPHAPTSELHIIPIAWPFAQWGLNQVGSLPNSSQGSHTYLLVAVDKFSKWIVAVPVTNQEQTMAVKFFESIVYRYGVPNSIITDNGRNFTSGKFQEFAKEFSIKIKYASVAHPKSNGQVEKANGLVCGVMTHKYRGSQQSSREVLPKFIDSTQGEPKNICKP